MVTARLREGMQPNDKLGLGFRFTDPRFSAFPIISQENPNFKDSWWLKRDIPFTDTGENSTNILDRINTGIVAFSQCPTVYLCQPGSNQKDKPSYFKRGNLV